MKDCISKSRRMLQKVFIGVTLYSVTLWPWENAPAAEDIPTELSRSHAQRGNEGKAPDIFFPETTHAFGKVFIGEKVKHVYKVVNRGAAVLDINEVSVGCNCTVAKLKNWHIPPGGEEEMEVTFSPDENTSVGKTAKFVYVNTNDPDTPKYKLKFTANVRADVIYTPKEFDLGFVPRGDAGAKRIVFKSKLNPADFNISNATSFHTSVGVSYGKLNDTGEWYVDASIKPGTNVGRLAGNITVFTNSAKQPEIKITTHAEVVQEVAAVPNRICFGKLAKGKEAVRSLTIIHAKGVKVEKVEPSLSWISANVATADNTDDTSTGVELKLLSDNAPKGKSEGTLSIYTNSQKFPVLKIHLCANVLESQT